MGILSIHPLAKLLAIMLPVNCLFSLVSSVINSSCYSNVALSSVAKITYKKRKKRFEERHFTPDLSRHWLGGDVAGTPNHSCKPVLAAPVSGAFSHSMSRLGRDNLKARLPELAVLSNTQCSAIWIINSSFQCLKSQFIELLQIITAGLWKWASKYELIQQEPDWFSL